MEEKVKAYLPQTWADPRIEFRTSRISGQGMFAREPIKKGEVVCIVGGIVMTDAHWAAVRFARSDFIATGETPTLRRMATVGGVPTKEMFILFPKKPAKKLAYVAGLPKPVGCV